MFWSLFSPHIWLCPYPPPQKNISGHLNIIILSFIHNKSKILINCTHQNYFSILIVFIKEYTSQQNDFIIHCGLFIGLVNRWNKDDRRQKRPFYFRGIATNCCTAPACVLLTRETRIQSTTRRRPAILLRTQTNPGKCYLKNPPNNYFVVKF